MKRRLDKRLITIFNVFFMTFYLILFGGWTNPESALELQFQHLLPKDGLDNRYNDFIKKDRQGFVWISALDGLYRFDGLHLKKYKPTPLPMVCSVIIFRVIFLKIPMEISGLQVSMPLIVT